MTNDAGERSITVQLKVLDVPGPVRNLVVENLMATKCTVVWDPPAEDGGSAVTNYIVEKRETTRVTWTQVATDVQNRYVKIGHLVKGNEYLFRFVVTANFVI